MPRLGKVTVFPARKIVTMCETQPTARAVAVADGRVVAVGTMKTLEPWTKRDGASVDDRFKDKVLMPGFIDPHVHPSLPAVCTQFPFLAPDDWSLPTGNFPGARTPEDYIARLKTIVAAHKDPDLPCIVFGFHQLWHGDQYRPQLNALFPKTAVILWHRSFHELICNDEALKWFHLAEKDVRGKPEQSWEKGHFWENGAAPLVAKLAAVVCAPKRYAKGMATFFGMLHRAGVTSCLDMGIGVFGDPTGEAGLIVKTAEEIKAPCRAILTPTQFDFLTRNQSPAQAFEQAEAWAKKYKSRRVFLDRHFKLQVDGAIFGGLSQYGFPGYMDGHAGMWMAPPEVFLQYAEPFWKAGYQIHAHINGDLSADLFIDIIRRLQDIKPRVGHRATLEHFAYATEDQCRQLKELGIVVSGNPYYQYILSDIYAREFLGEDRAHYMNRFGTLARLGIPFALHSDCPMAPLSPLTLAWSAANRLTINGNLNGPAECVSLDAALRAITIDAAWILRRETEVGSIRAGKLADFAVLEEDPYEVGARGLKDIPIWGTVFEGEVHPVKK